jgi:23S rRNA U2552 (ribose-2'-O)-methylase RlmE/FtsJ
MNILNWKLFLEELVGEKPISNYDRYITEMEKGMGDKLFFINEVDFDVIVDFGCANGSFLAAVQKLKPEVKIIGYDLDDEMLRKASDKLGDKALLTNNWSDVILEISKYRKPLLNLSSVIHEVYSYSHPNLVKKFWENQVFGGDFKWITIRDMIPSVQMHRNEIEKFKDDVEKVRQKADTRYLSSFEDRWENIGNNYRTLVHFLLKYKYTDNWSREVNENYLPITLETLKKKIPTSYKIIKEDAFVLPFIQKQIFRDFGVKITHSTHVKMIIRNSRFK